MADITGRQLRTLTLVPACIALNIVMGQIVALIKLPLYLDSVGTVLVAALAGPAAGALTGCLGSALWALLSNPPILPFAVTAGAIGLLAGVSARLGAFRRLPTTLAAGLVTGTLAAFISAPIVALLYGGVTGAGTDLVVGLLRSRGLDAMHAALYQGLGVDPLDKAISFTLVWSVVHALPLRYRLKFS